LWNGKYLNICFKQVFISQNIFIFCYIRQKIWGLKKIFFLGFVLKASFIQIKATKAKFKKNGGKFLKAA
jgi:hypothetical protein